MNPQTPKDCEAPVCRVAILGGGVAGLVTAFELTREEDWKKRFEITVYQMGWRLGGKCASSRGAHGRIEEHGIHAFLGRYYNALPLFAECYDTLGRTPGEALAKFEQAFLPASAAMLWEWRNGRLTPWPLSFPRNPYSPRDPAPFHDTLRAALRGVIELFAAELTDWRPAPLTPHALVKRTARGFLDKAADALARDLVLGPNHPLVELIERGWRWLGRLTYPVIECDDTLRRFFFTVDHLLTLISGALKADVAVKGYDALDSENWSDWMRRNGAHPATLSSPVAFNHLNITYQYPHGDTTLPPQMGAGCYLYWCLQAPAYMGSFLWHFAAGSGETLIAPLYEVLKRRGVTFAFFHKVEELHLSDDRTRVNAVTIAVQATPTDLAGGYRPLICAPVDGKPLPAWPAHPLYDQLVEGAALEAGRVDLESYWAEWDPPARTRLAFGEDFDEVVLAIPPGAATWICREILDHSAAWRDMVAQLPALCTQAMQIWLRPSLDQLGWTLPLANGDFVITPTYVNPMDGHADFSALLAYEDWPEPVPRSLWYFCGPLAEWGEPPHAADHGYPRRQNERVKAHAIQYLQAVAAPLWPAATSDRSTPPADPMGLDFNLLVDNRDPPGVGVARFDAQFWRANVEPSERYIASPPESSAFRLTAWGSGFANLTLAGDWIYTGVNVGSVEGAVMSGKLAAHALSGRPRLADIVGYPTVGPRSAPPWEHGDGG